MKVQILRITAFLILVFNLPAAVQGQNPNLANQYFMNGEYEKAAELYSQLLETDRGLADYYFERYFDCLLNLEKYDDAEKAVKKQLKQSPNNVKFYVFNGNLYDRMGKTDEANAEYEKAIAKMSPDYASVNSLANTFINAAKYDFAIKTYERGGAMFKDATRFAFNLGELYRRKGNTPKMIESYLNSLDSDPGRLITIQTQLARYLAESEFTELQSQLYTRLQSDNNADYIELLAWSFVQNKDFKSALRQYKALDKRLGEPGQRIFKLANDAANARDFDTAIAGFEYIIQEKGPQNPFFFDAKREAMNCRRRKITEGFDYTLEELRTLEAEYESFLNQYDRGRSTAFIIIQLADLEAYYINDLNKAIKLLDELRQSPGLNRNTLARVKINLADFYLMSGEIWESTLLYSQVDKDFREEMLGQEARFKNAKLSYFNGDFEWAQAQFNVLKASTSKLIANDALDLSVFIMDNLNSDTTTDAMQLYATAEMLVFQNRFDEAFLRLDTIRTDYPENTLQDDILYLEAQISEKKRNYTRAAELYQQVAEKYPEDIRADNALFALAKLNEEKLDNTEKAKELYEKIFIDYSGSVFAVEARKRFRILRGDKMQ
ncbi:MAG: tetratricopeptide repeat protein [Lewinellaceae bacterium]|nr:tetratricopeptide repeat protein [Saprospiraceae bacterium]MCB9316139.1 tetratricopeptide repeat protein [Lewinellaceae bacterium]MCB9333377.1 tetratricopeptide repeat protein [Lewinellaceae bacterium]